MFPPLAIFCSHAGRAWEQGHYFTSLMQLASWTTHTCTRGLISCLQHQKVSKASRSHKQYLHSQTPRHGPIKSLKTLSIPLKDTVCQSDRVVSCWKLSTQHTIHPQSAIELAEPRKGRHTEPHNETLILQPRWRKAFIGGGIDPPCKVCEVSQPKWRHYGACAIALCEVLASPWVLKSNVQICSPCDVGAIAASNSCVGRISPTPVIKWICQRKPCVKFG